MELIRFPRAAACCTPAGGHSWPSFLFTASTTAPVLIGRADATLSKATGCAVYQLTSASRTKEQLSGWWASASWPSEFSASTTVRTSRTACRPTGNIRGTSWKGVWGWDNRIAGSAVRAQPLGGLGRFLSRGAFRHGSWQPKLAAPDATTRSIRSEECAVGIDGRAESFSGGRLGRDCPWRISTVPHCTRGYCERGAATHAAACKFGLKRTAGSLCASGSDRLAEASRRSVRC